MHRFVPMVIAGLILALQAPAAKSERLAASSTGLDWLAADADQRVAWSQQMARLFNKEDAFGEAVDACLGGMLGDREDLDMAVLDEMRQGDLPMLTAGCVLTVQTQDAPSQ